MDKLDTKKAYKTPHAKVVKVNVQGVLCSSQEGKNTENFTLGSNKYDEDDWS